MNAGGSPLTRDEEPSVGGVRVSPVWSVVLYALLVVAAGMALYAQRAPNIDPSLARIAPWLFMVFALGFSAYRFALVAARRYSPFKAFLQVSLAVIFGLTLMFPKPPATEAQVQTGLFGHADSRVRAMAAEVSGWRGEMSSARSLVSLLSDESVEVRVAAHAALVKLNAGEDLGAAEDGAAREAWRKRFP